MRWLLNVRLRAATFMLAIVPVLILRPIRGHGFEVFLSPVGAILAGILLLASGSMVEERGGATSIRLAAALQAIAAAFLVGASIYAYANSRYHSLEHVEGFVWPVLAAMVAHLVYCVVNDVGTAFDPRFGQAIRLVALDAEAIRLRSSTGEVVIPTSAVRESRAERFRSVWWVSVRLESRERIHGAVQSLPWMPRDPNSTTIRLTERQLGMDANVFVGRLSEMIERAGKYR